MATYLTFGISVQDAGQAVSALCTEGALALIKETDSEFKAAHASRGKV